MSEPGDEQHAEETTKYWVKSCSKAQRDPDPSGAFVAYVCDVLERYAAGRVDLDDEVQAEVATWCRRLKLNPVHVWNAIVQLAHALPRKIG